VAGRLDGDVPCPVDTGLVSADAAVAVTVAAIAVANPANHLPTPRINIISINLGPWFPSSSF